MSNTNNNNATNSVPNILAQQAQPSSSSSSSLSQTTASAASSTTPPTTTNNTPTTTSIADQSISGIHLGANRKAIKEIPNTTKKINIEFLCPICMDILEDAQVTKCGHTFCLKCITQNLTEHNRCPQCNHFVDQFFPNFLLNQLAVKYKNMKSLEQEFTRVNPNKPLNDLKRLVIEKSDDLSIKEIDEIFNVLRNKKICLEQEMKIKQNELLKEFLEKALKKKTDESRIIQHELSQIQNDYEQFLKMIDSEQSHSTLPSLNNHNNNDTNMSNDSTTLQQNTLTNVIQESSPKTPTNATVPTFNSYSLGSCNHIDLKLDNPEFNANHLQDIRRKRMNFYFNDLEKSYFDRCKTDAIIGIDSTTRINNFRKDLNKFMLYSQFRPLASLEYARDSNIVSSIEFDKDIEYFAIAGVAKKIKIFDYASVLKDSLGHCYPINDIECTSKISCLSWNSYYKTMMATSDYEGNVIIWDAFLSQKLNVFQEHEKRCWSVDFNKIDGNLVASGSDDSRVKLWSTNMELSVATLNSSANICSVKFNPQKLHHLAFASADHRVYYYDLRNTKSALLVFEGHRKAVSYVKFLNEKELVSASTDSQIKLWNTEHRTCIRSYKGHINDKNFVGLTTNDDFFACGSENNSLYVYYKGVEKQILSYTFNKMEKEDVNDFVSAVCWRNASNVILAANSQGIIMILELV